MVNLRTDLLYATPAAWAETALADFPALLQDHANMERKASAQAMSFVVKYPDRAEIIPTLIETAQEELDHFRQVYERMSAAGIPLAPDREDRYMKDLIAGCRTGRDERFLDRMLLVSIVETRGAERFRLISEAHPSAEWRTFYRDLWACEAKHGNVFVEMALRYFTADTVFTRLSELTTLEAAVIQRMPWGPSLH